ncbi:MAG: aminomethyltransferase family protein [Parvibaculum sp.]
MTEIDLFRKGRQVELERTNPLSGPAVEPDPAWFEQSSNEPPFARHVHTTPLHLVTSVESRTNDWTVWNGYTVPNVHTHLAAEYDALHSNAGLSDISPLVKMRISGKEAVAYLDHLLTMPVGRMKQHDTRRAFMCAGNGQLVTEGILFRLDETEFRLITRSKHLDWFLDAGIGFGASVDDISGTLAGLSLSGPRAPLVLAEAGLERSADLARGKACWEEPGRMPTYVSRTGLLGESQFELWIDPEDAPLLWNRLLAAGKHHAIRPVGEAARNVARLEQGVFLEGRDFASAFASSSTLVPATPYDLGLGTFVKLDRATFNGQAALRRLVTSGAGRAPVAFTIAGNEADQLGAIYAGGRKAGRITSHTWSPALHTHIALGLMDIQGLGTSGAYALDVLTFEGVAEKRTAHFAKRPLLAAGMANLTE